MTTTTNSTRCLPGDSSMPGLRYLPRRKGRHDEPAVGWLRRTVGGGGGGVAGREDAPSDVPPEAVARARPEEDGVPARGIGPVFREPEPRAQPAEEVPEPEPPAPPDPGRGSGG